MRNDENFFEAFTRDRYNETMRMLSKRRTLHGIFFTVAASASAALFYLMRSLLPYGNTPLRYLSIAWIMGIPVVVVSFYWFMRYSGSMVLPENIVVPPDRIIFQLTTIGKAPRTVHNSIRSVHHWARRIGINYESWIITEENALILDTEYAEKIRAEGTRIVVVPSGYETPNGTRSKARALHYACELRRGEMGLNDRVWIYHQDDETSVGEDTILGICDLISAGKYNIGSGIIIYPLNFQNTPDHVQEFMRSYDDFRAMGSLLTRRNPLIGFHGSHFVVRQSVEDSVGNDFGTRKAIAEDFLLENAIREKYGGGYGVIRGFAYEQSAGSIRAKLTQRRRWFIGALGLYPMRGRLPLYKKALVLYTQIAWMSAVLSLAAMVLSVVFRFDSVIPYSGVFFGVVWYGMVISYYEGYRLHRPYIGKISAWRAIANGIIGGLSDAIAPWYSLLTYRNWLMWLDKDSVSARKSTGEPEHSVGR